MKEGECIMSDGFSFSDGGDVLAEDIEVFFKDNKDHTTWNTTSTKLSVESERNANDKNDKKGEEIERHHQEAAAPSEVSSRSTTISTASSTSYLSEVTISPPSVIHIKIDRRLDPKPSFPYAQLCFDPQEKELVPMLEVAVAGRSKRPRLRIPLSIAAVINSSTPEEFPWLMEAISCSSTNSSLSNETESGATQRDTRISDPITLSSWIEYSEMDMHLLPNSRSGRYSCKDEAETIGCTQALKKRIASSWTFLKDVGIETGNYKEEYFGYELMN